jgi:hypothetical protein
LDINKVEVHAMSRATCTALLMIVASSANAVTAQDQLGKGVLGIAWGAPLAEVQARYPHGLTWATTHTDGNFYAYEVQVPETPFGMAGVHTHFYFDKDEKLQSVHFMFDYDQKDDALYRIGEYLGQDYSPSSTNTSNTYRWHPSIPISVSMSIGKTRHYGWVMLAIDAPELLKQQEWQAKQVIK